MPAGRFLQARGTEGGPADLARSTAEGVGGYAINDGWDFNVKMTYFCMLV